MGEHGDGWDVVDRLLETEREAPGQPVTLTPEERKQLLTVIAALAKSADDTELYADHSSSE